MGKTVIGIFEYESDAQDAQNYLLSNGFADGNVDIKIASYKSEPAKTAVHDEDEDILDKIGHFFRTLFDGDDDEVTRYAEAGKRGTIVTVHATSAEEAELAAQVLDNHGAVDVTKSLANLAPGQVEGNPILDPPGAAYGLGTQATPAGTGSLPLRSRIIDRPVHESYRLRQQGLEGDQVPLNRTVAERDAMLNDIIDNDEMKPKNPNNGDSFASPEF
ncbi:hypothetical protein [Dyadobacter sandarakinus]|uniref:General stress protein 17M-like domain-containing protein n=1 Tax=Dyadobacter sandarakinus TaxID=2747268 RepID=A0ABX7I1N5_9BACT|nr:hypothetical protein [Dyadobacter sandarakinus]QRQ99839.1 hypothetical protein HWI92_02360 [Dyadobacter sandarakinus]